MSLYKRQFPKWAEDFKPQTNQLEEIDEEDEEQDGDDEEMEME